MTTVLACAVGDRILMAADSCTNVYERPLHDAARKVVRLPAGDEEVLIGVSGSAGMPDVLHAGLKLDAVPVEDEDPQAWAHAVAVAATELAVEAGLVEAGRMESNLLLGWRGHLWTLVHSCALRHPDGRAALGSGEGSALGALDALLDVGVTPAEAIVRAVQIACRRDRYSEPPIYLELLAPQKRKEPGREAVAGSP
ncbi:hypothetical protein I0C86_41335 [Plantactinospora sp. S1510]|uniref:Peptidase n=1 Tax=Plantactinospora alkalitolerans TaxID=2789879 RepID=A0ABS0HB09_9ACTN|nr:hypothetical protein [Plantactinospora alkalitolerans]MBF9135297.1 hypothetical protein [Plantactinospora alkalitolerans]